MKGTFWQTLVIALMIELAAGNAVQAQDSGFGLGIILGEPTGLTLKKWLSPKTAIDFAAAWSFEGKDSITIHGDVLAHKYGNFDLKEGKLPIYYGIGYRIRFGDDQSRLGGRIPLGVNYHFEDTPLDVFFEMVPVLELIPDTDFDLDAAIGIRYFFSE